MGEISEIKARVELLTSQEQAELRAWFLERDAMLWDQQIASDLAAGKLEALIAEAISDRDVGNARHL